MTMAAPVRVTECGSSNDLAPAAQSRGQSLSHGDSEARPRQLRVCGVTHGDLRAGPPAGSGRGMQLPESLSLGCI